MKKRTKLIHIILKWLKTINPDDADAVSVLADEIEKWDNEYAN